MDRKEVAKKIREAIFNRIEEDRAIHASSIEQEVEKVLGAMSIGHYPGRGASAPIPDMHTLTLSEPPACTHTISSTGGVLKKPDQLPTVATGTIYNNGQHTFVWLGNCWVNLSYSWDMVSGVAEALSTPTEAQVDIITHPEAADK